MPLLSQLESALSALPDGALVVGYSGGLDSHALLHALAQSPIARARGLRALHVDHGLHADSAAWAEHGRRMCAALPVPIQIVTVQVQAGGDGPEAAARRARWQAFAEHTGADEILVLAHHRDDQAETVLLRLLRGAGAAGLAAMRAWSQHDAGLRVWRPLLDQTRSTLHAYADLHQLNVLHDPANADPRYDRNYLRQAVLPLLRARWPQAGAALAQSAQRLADAYALEQSAATVLLAQAATTQANSLALPPLLAADRTARWAALRAWLARMGVPDLGADRLARIEAELIGAAADGNPCIDLRQCLLRRYRDRLYALAPGSDAPLRYRLPWDGRAPLQVPAGVLRLEPAPTQALTLTVANRSGGERLRVHAGGPQRELRLLLQEHAVPPWLRARWPVLWLDDEAVAFADAVVTTTLRDRLEALGSQLQWQPD